MWPVHEIHVMEGDLLKGMGQQRLYFPMAHTRLPFELAKVNTDIGAVSFANKYGLLGHPFIFADTVEGVKGDRLDFFMGHVLQVRRLLALYRSVHLGEEELADNLAVLIGKEPTDRPTDQKPVVPYWFGANLSAIRYTALGRHTKESLAFDILATVISRNTTNLRPMLQRRDDDAGLVIQYRWGVMLEVLYWHLAILVTGNKTLGQCENCGRHFEMTDRRQLFCPPDEQQIAEAKSGLRSRAQSACALRYRARKHRVGKEKSKENANG